MSHLRPHVSPVLVHVEHCRQARHDGRHAPPEEAVAEELGSIRALPRDGCPRERPTQVDAHHRHPAEHGDPGVVEAVPEAVADGGRHDDHELVRCHLVLVHVVDEDKEDGGEQDRGHVGQHDLAVQVLERGQRHVDEHGDHEKDEAKEAAQCVGCPQAFVERDQVLVAAGPMEVRGSVSGLASAGLEFEVAMEDGSIAPANINHSRDYLIADESQYEGNTVTPIKMVDAKARPAVELGHSLVFVDRNQIAIGQETDLAVGIDKTVGIAAAFSVHEGQVEVLYRQLEAGHRPRRPRAL